MTEFLYASPSGLGNTQGPALLLYLLNICAKALINQFISESGVNPKTADALGILGTAIFAMPDFQWEGRLSFIDIFLAKYHVVCPVLFGVASNEDRTQRGKLGLGWRREDGAFVSEQRHFERMTGLGAGPELPVGARAPAQDLVDVELRCILSAQL